MKLIFTFNYIYEWVAWEGEGGFRGRENILVVEIKIKQLWDLI